MVILLAKIDTDIMKRLVVLTGSGISAESGLKTFRDSGGLWEGHRVEEVASPEGFASKPEKVLEFYNARRKQAKEALPNAAHLALAEMQEYFEVIIITQNVDELHEKAGSKLVMHLHGSLFEGRSSVDPDCIVRCEDDMHIGDKAPDGSQLRPNVVWFGESVPLLTKAAQLSAVSDIFMIVGTSLSVYPANTLVDFVEEGVPIYVVDPVIPAQTIKGHVTYIEKAAVEGLPELAQQLILAEQNSELDKSSDSKN